jgi:c-di-GMP-binding flagellar brake protein YcgR
MLDKKQHLKVGGLLMILTQTGRIETKVEKISGNSVWVLNISNELEKAGMAGKKIEAIYLMDTSVYFLKAEVKYKEDFIDGISMTRIVLLEAPVKNERRESFRLRQSFDLYLTEPDGEKKQKLYGVDISDTGLGFLSRGAYPCGEVFYFEFTLGDQQYLLTGEIVRVIPPDSGNVMFKVGVRFVALPEPMKKGIRKYIYMQQAAKRK